MPDGPAYVYASEIQNDGVWVHNHVVFCPTHFHTVAMPLSRDLAEKVAASHNEIFHPKVPVPPNIFSKGGTGRLDYFDVCTEEVRRVA